MQQADKERYSKGDEVLVKCIVMTDTSDAAAVEFTDAPDCTLWISHDNIVELCEPKPIVWRDGAVEAPEHCTSVYSIDKDQGGESIMYIRSANQTSSKWKGCYWLPADEFPMPEVPKPTIEPCPFCGGACECAHCFIAEKYFVMCESTDNDGCGYGSSSCDTEQKAIDAHNALCRRLE